jgi:hypothetical protein
MRGVIVHGALLFVALIFGYQTWTRDKTVAVKEPTGTIKIFTKPFASLKAVSWETPDRTTKLERSGEGAGAYFWGTETKTTTKPVKKPKPDPDAGAVAVPEPPPEVVTTTREFPLNDETEKLLQKLAALPALRKLGKLDQAQLADYELGDSTVTFNLVFDDGARSFVVSNKALKPLKADDRFVNVIDSETGEAYALAKEIVEPFVTGESKVRLKEVHSFKDEDLTAATVTSKGKTVSLVRAVANDDSGKQKQTWARAESPTIPDQTMANLVKRIDDLRASKYETELDPATLEELVTVKLSTAAGKDVGYATLYKRVKDEEATPTPTPAAPTPAAPTPGAPTPAAPDAAAAAEPAPPPAPKAEAEYFIKTERTRVLGVVIKSAAERIELDLAEMQK